MRDTHFVPYDAPGNRIAMARCGKHVNRAFDHSPQPTCQVCADEQAKYEALDLGQYDADSPVRFAPEESRLERLRQLPRATPAPVPLPDRRRRA